MAPVLPESITNVLLVVPVSVFCSWDNASSASSLSSVDPERSVICRCKSSSTPVARSVSAVMAFWRLVSAVFISCRIFASSAFALFTSVVISEAFFAMAVS